MFHLGPMYNFHKILFYRNWYLISANGIICDLWCVNCKTQLVFNNKRDYLFTFVIELINWYAYVNNK